MKTKKNINKLVVYSTIALASAFSLNNVQALTVTETTGTGKFDKIDANTTVIGITKFADGQIVTSGKTRTAVGNYFRFTNDVAKDPEIYYYLGEWYALDEDNNPTIVEKQETLDTLDIYYVNNEEKKLEIELDLNIDEGSALVFNSDNASKNDQIKYEDGKVLIPATLKNIEVLIKNETTDEVIKIDEIKITEKNVNEPVPTAKVVNTLDELKAAIAAKDSIIRIGQDIKNITETIVIPYETVVDGNNHTLSFAKLNKVNGVASGLVLMANDSIVNNLTVELTAQDGWQGNYAVQVYGVTGVKLNNVTAKNGDAGILVNSSKVELTGTTTLSNNEFGGIEVSKSSNEGMKNSELTVTGTIAMDNEATAVPLIWIEKEQGTVVTKNTYAITGDTNDKGQTFYYSDAKYVTIAKVSTQEELEAALANSNISKVILTSDITKITKTISALNKITLEGNNHKLSFSALNKVNGVASGLVLMANDSVVNNLTVELTAQDGWQGNYAVQVYGVTGVKLNNVTAKNGDAGILVNSSKVELTGTTTLSNNEFGGIEVSKSSNEGMKNSELTVTGTIAMDNEATAVPLIWIEKEQGTVVTKNTYTVTGDTNDKGQTFYYSDAKYVID